MISRRVLLVLAITAIGVSSTLLCAQGGPGGTPGSPGRPVPNPSPPRPMLPASPSMPASPASPASMPDAVKSIDKSKPPHKGITRAVSKEEFVGRMEQVFDKYDKDKTGKLDKTQYDKMLKEIRSLK